MNNYQAPLIKGDYRIYTDYRPSCSITSMIMQQNNISNSYDLKTLLMNNALSFQERNRNFYKSKVVNGEYYIPDPNSQLKYWKTYRDNLQKQVDDTKCQQ